MRTTQERRRYWVVNQEYESEILMQFRSRYLSASLPAKLSIRKGRYFDGGAWEGHIYIYEGVIQQSKMIRMFAIAHELSHIVTTTESNRFGLGKEIPKEGEYYKAEYLADLISIHVLFEYNPSLAWAIKNKLYELEDLLGPGDSTHPSGTNRRRLLERYFLERSGLLNHAAQGEPKQGLSQDVFPKLFSQVWHAVGKPWCPY